MHNTISRIITGAALAAVVSIGGSLSAADAAKDAAKDGTIRRTAWSFDRSEIGWYNPEPAKIAEKKQKGLLSELCGWVEYDVEIPAAGWYELVLFGGVPGWERDVYLDGERLVTLGIAGAEDMIGKEAGKELNAYLAKGKHAIRFRRLGFPGVLPGAFELRPADGRAEGCVFARIHGQSILRVGEKLRLKVTAGTTVPTEYELVALGQVRPSETVLGKISFPACSAPVTRTVDFPCAAEGVFAIRAKVGGALLRPNDFRAGTFAVVDTRRAAQAPKALKKTLIHDIDCVKQTDLGRPIAKDAGFWEATEPTRISKSEAGEYRESGDGADPSLPYPPMKPSDQKYNSGFAYAIDVPTPQELYLLEVDYPDDDRRTVNVFIVEPILSMPCQLYGGYETGDWFELSNTMQTQKILFWARGEKVRAAILSKNPGMRAAASKIRVYRIEGGLTEGGAPTDGGRLMAHWMEEPTRWLQHGLPPDNLDRMSQDFVAIDRYVALCRHHGFNAVSPTEAIYQTTTFYTDELEGWFQSPYDAARLVALFCEKHGIKYIPDLHLSGQGYFNRQVVEKLVKDPAELYIYSRLGTSAKGSDNWFAAPWNPLHPAIQEKYIAVIGALADKVADSPAFAGVSSRLMNWVWQGWNGLPSLNWGYGDWDMAQFEKDTGVKTPGDAKDSDRFQKRFEFLTAPGMINQWLAWRNGRMLDYYQRIRDRIRKAKPDAVLYLPYSGDAISGMDLTFGSYFQTDVGALKETGIELETLEKIPGICLTPGGGFGRRDLGDLVADAGVSDSVADPGRKRLGFGYERAFSFGNAYFEDQAQVPVHQLGVPDWDIKKAGGSNGAAEGAGRNVLEKLAYALADQDSSTLVQGGMGYTFGRPEEYNEFLSEYERLPKIPFQPFDPMRDPVAAWYAELRKPGLFGGSAPEAEIARKFDEGMYFYLVNREPYPVQCRIELAGASTVTRLSSGKALRLDGAVLKLELKPFQIAAFRTALRAELTGASVAIPPERIERVKSRLAFCQELAREITVGSRRNDVSDEMRAAFQKQLDAAWEAARQGHWWRARTALSNKATITVFNKLALWPENQLHRRMGLGLLKTERRGRGEAGAAEMLDADRLMKSLVPGSDAVCVDSASYNPAWLFSKAVKTEKGELAFELEIPCPGLYQLSLGHVASEAGAMMVALAGKGMATLAQTRTPGQPEKTVFPAVTLPAGTSRLTVKGQTAFGIYGVTLQPIYRPVPSPNWMTVGPFPSKWYSGAPGETVKAAMTRADPPMKAVDTAAVYDVDGAKLAWSYSDKISGGVPHFDERAGVSFLFRCKVQQNLVCYAVTFITSPDERDAEILIGCDWWANAWLNGEQLQTARDAKAVEGDGCFFSGWRPLPAKAHLKKGVNMLLVKTHGGTVANWFTCYLSDPGDLTIGNQAPAAVEKQ